MICPFPAELEQYESKNNSFFTETDLFKEILKFINSEKKPKNLSFSFLRSTNKILTKLNPEKFKNIKPFIYNIGRYCWATTDCNEVYYITPELDIYRCSYTVGRKEYRIGNILYKKINYKKWINHNFFQIRECKNCKIGPYCGGGCYLSFSRNKKRQCEEEKSNFDNFIKNIIIPYINKEILNMNNKYL